MAHFPKQCARKKKELDTNGERAVVAVTNNDIH